MLLNAVCMHPVEWLYVCVVGGLAAEAEHVGDFYISLQYQQKHSSTTMYFTPT